MEENHITKIKNNNKFFRDNNNHYIASTIDQSGHFDFFGSEAKDDHLLALSRYFKEHEKINDYIDSDHFLPHVLNFHQVRDKIFNDNKTAKTDFNEYCYANYLIKVLNNEGYIFVKDYTDLDDPLNQVFAYIPSNIDSLSKKQKEVLKDMNDRADEQDVNLTIIGFNSYEDATHDRQEEISIDDLIEKEHQL